MKLSQEVTCYCSFCNKTVIIKPINTNEPNVTYSGKTHSGNMFRKQMFLCPTCGGVVRMHAKKREGNTRVEGTFRFDTRDRFKNR